MTNYQEEEECIELPPGFRFHPTDEEIITHYLLPKVANPGAFVAIAMGEVDLNKCEAWDLPSKAKMEGKKEWYFYCRRDRKYPTGTRANRATAAGFWKATGKDREIFRGRGVLVGTRKTLVFYRGRAPNGEKTNWVMHEYRLEGAAASIFAALPKFVKEEWVVCRVIQKGAGGGGEKGSSSTAPPSCLERIRSFGNGFLLPPLVVDTSLSSFSNKKLEGFDDLSAVMNDNLAESSYSQLESAQRLQYNYSGYLQQQETPFAMRRPTNNIYPTQHGPQQITSALELTGRRSTADHNTAILSAVMNDNPAASSYAQLEPAQSWQYNYSGYLRQQETPPAMRRPTKNIYQTQQGPKQIASAQELTGRRSTADHNTAISSVVSSLEFDPSCVAGTGPLLD